MPLDSSPESRNWFDAHFADSTKTLTDGWYHQVRASQAYRYGKSLALVAPVLADGGFDILDVGCGLGDISSSLLTLGSANRVTGVDVSENAIKVADRLYPGARFEVGSLPELRFLDSTFDLVVALEVVYYLDDSGRIEATRTLKRVLRPGGYLLFSSVLDDGSRYFRESEALDVIRESFGVEKVEFTYARVYSRLERPLLGWLRKLDRAAGLIRLSDAGFARWRTEHDSPAGTFIQWMRLLCRGSAGKRLCQVLFHTARSPITLVLGVTWLPPALNWITQHALGDAGKTHIFVLAQRRR